MESKFLKWLKQKPKIRGKAYTKRELIKYYGLDKANQIMEGRRRGFGDSTGYYWGYCQCRCAKCLEGKVHCRGLVCRGD